VPPSAATPDRPPRGPWGERAFCPEGQRAGQVIPVAQGLPTTRRLLAQPEVGGVGQAARTSDTPRSMGPPYSRSARTPSPRNRGRAILSAGRVCLDSALPWWPRLLGVFPVWDSEPGSVFGPIPGDPDPVTPCRDRVVPVCNSDS